MASIEALHPEAIRAAYTPESSCQRLIGWPQTPELPPEANRAANPSQPQLEVNKVTSNAMFLPEVNEVISNFMHLPMTMSMSETNGMVSSVMPMPETDMQILSVMPRPITMPEIDGVVSSIVPMPETDEVFTIFLCFTENVTLPLCFCKPALCLLVCLPQNLGTLVDMLHSAAGPLVYVFQGTPGGAPLGAGCSVTYFPLVPSALCFQLTQQLRAVGSTLQCLFLFHISSPSSSYHWFSYLMCYDHLHLFSVFPMPVMKYSSCVY